VRVWTSSEQRDSSGSGFTGARAEGFQRQWIHRRRALRIRRLTSTAKSCANHKPVSAPYPPLDWSDRIAVSAWLAGLRVSFNDADAVALDMLRPPRARELGPKIHARNYCAARAQILEALDYASAPEPDDGEGGDPAGTGGAGPVH